VPAVASTVNCTVTVSSGAIVVGVAVTDPVTPASTTRAGTTTETTAITTTVTNDASRRRIAGTVFDGIATGETKFATECPRWAQARQRQRAPNDAVSGIREQRPVTARARVRERRLDRDTGRRASAFGRDPSGPGRSPAE
jgi:hypothetical protein